MSDKLNIYDCDALIKVIEAKAEMNDGELSDEDMQQIVLAQTSSIEQLGKLVGYIKYLEGNISLAKSEIDRIQARKRMAENRINSIKNWLLPYIQKKGAVNVGTHRLSTRKSQGVVLADGFNNPQYGEEVTTFKPDKKAIKESIKNGIEVKGAVLEDRISVQIR
jgi:hypothetical protein